MSRRSSRLVSGGYYNSDEESDSSSVTNISYRENPVKVFKKLGARKSSKAKSNASYVSSETPVTADVSLTSSPLSSPTQPTMRTVPYTPTVATPRPALAPSSSRGQTPTRSSSVAPEQSRHAGLCSSSAPALHCRANHKELSQSGVDSSGYSSSEGTYRKPLPVTSKTSRISSSSGTPSPGYRSRIRSALYSLMGEHFVFVIMHLPLCCE
ncbi:mucin-5AC [Nematolebias whitei]|uniref:mucin-5AC n=1 Tax=Nematolebias whitei TaxID=451745 RepID=UPI0018980AE7|nr:mucin-5AC [Nematolebias whitei]